MDARGFETGLLRARVNNFGRIAELWSAYLEAKFPSANHPAWTDPDVAVKPVFAAPQRAERIASAD